MGRHEIPPPLSKEHPEAHYYREVIDLTDQGRRVLAGRRSEGIYVLKFGIELPETRMSAAAFTAASLEEWHRRFGHVSMDRIKDTAEKKAVDGLEIVENNNQPSKCIDCSLGKCKRTSHPERTTLRAGKPGVSLHFDTMGPFKQESLDGYRYLLLCKDEASSYKIGRPVVTKTEITDHVKRIISRTGVETGNNTLRIITDNGSEFVNRDLEQFLKERGIYHLTSTPYTPQQNGSSREKTEQSSNQLEQCSVTLDCPKVSGQKQ